MNNKPLVSVVIPFLNAGRFIDETIQSVFAQTYKNWELILIDDGSQDNSKNIAKKYASLYTDKVYYLEHENHTNKGTSASRNLGIKNSKGEYVATLDADDIWIPEKLEQQVSILEPRPQAAMVFGNTLYWYSWTEDLKDKESDFYSHDVMKPGTLKLNSIVEPPSILVNILSNSMPGITPSNIMFRKSFSDEVGGFEEIFTGMHDDHVFLAKIFLQYPVYVSEECWDIYRQHDESCVAVAEKEGRFLNAELFYLNWLKDYIDKKGFNDSELRWALRKRLFRYKYPRLYALAGSIIRLKRKYL